MTDRAPSSPRTRRAEPRPVTLDLAAEALSYIPPDVERDAWVRAAMALKSEFGDAGFDVWAQWSAASEGYSATEARATWRSIQAAGRVKIGSLFALAKEHGFRFPKDGAAAPAPEPSPEAQAHAAARQRQREIEAAQYRERADRAARVAADMWASASETGQSAYLERKGVRGHGVRFLPDGTVLVPMRDAAGALQSLQRIAPAGSDAAAPEKRYLAGARKSGLFHLIGTLGDDAAVLLAAEGYATAASLHEATGRPVAVAFDAGNLAHVARALRALHPQRPILVCGDDDRQTQERTGKNPGREKALAAARAADAPGAPGQAVFPQGLPDGGTDFNDLAAHAGAEAVRSIVDRALADLAAPQPRQTGPAGRRALQAARRGPDSGAGPGEALGPAEGRGGHAAGDDEPAPAWDAFTVNDDGVWHAARDGEGNVKRPQWLCARLDVTARTRSADANGWGYLLDFRDPDGNPKTWAMPAAMLGGDGSAWAGCLRDMGLQMAPGAAARNLVAKYIDTRNPPERVLCTDRVGWHGSAFVLPSGSISSGEGRRYVFQSDSGMEDLFRRSGELADWQAGVGALCVGNSRLVFAVCCALAGAMLRPAGMEGGGFHLRGHSSIGKTTVLKVAASVWGRPGYVQRWRTTDNALEATAAQHCDGLLILDEIGQVDGRLLGECAYMLANGQAKGRSTVGGLARKRRTWLLLFLSSGEVSMADHMAEAGRRIRAGQEVRMLDVPLDAGQGMGGFEQLHGREGAAQLAEEIARTGARHYGTAGRAWLAWAVANHAALPDRMQALVAGFLGEMVPESASQQVRRAGNRFALVAAAGELATQAGITGWLAGEARRAGRQCFAAWLAARGHLDNSEDISMLRQVRQFLEMHGEGRFTWWNRALNDHAPKTLQRVGFRRLLARDGKPIRTDAEHQTEYGERISAADGEAAKSDFIVLAESFRQEVCKGYEARAVAKLLAERGHLAHDPGRLTTKLRLPGMGNAWCYHIKPSLFEDDI